MQHLKQNQSKKLTNGEFFLGFFAPSYMLEEYICCMKLIVGLGNPGNEYALTRHNAGWIALDHVIKHLHGSEFRDSHHK